MTFKALVAYLREELRKEQFRTRGHPRYAVQQRAIGRAQGLLRAIRAAERMQRQKMGVTV